MKMPGLILPMIMAATSFAAAQPEIDVQGHRGARGLMPENTIAGMYKALDLGVTTLELDVVITKDKQVLLSHEPFFAHQISTHPNGKPVTLAGEKQLNIYQMTFAETQQFDVGKKVHPGFPKQQKISAAKPLLSAMIDSVEAYARKTGRPLPAYNIEIKSSPKGDGVYHPAPPEFTTLVMDVIRAKNLNGRFNIQSFDMRPLQEIHKTHPEVKLALLIGSAGSVAAHLKTLGFKPATYSPEYKLVDAASVKYCHDNGIKIIPWTVNTRPEIDKLLALGVDGIITDYPDLFVK